MTSMAMDDVALGPSEMHKEWRQHTLNSLHAVCNAHRELEHLRPTIRIIGENPVDAEAKRAVTLSEECPVYDDYPIIGSNMHAVAQQCSERWGITPQELLQGTRSSRYVPARKDFVRICRECLSKSYPEIAHIMGGRHHTSVLHYMQLVYRDRERAEHGSD